MNLRIASSLFIILVLAGCGDRRQSAVRVVAQAPTPSAVRLASTIPSLRQMNGLTCAQCHNALTVDTGGGKQGVSFSHQTHLHRGAHCNQCHGTLSTHGNRIKPGHPECFTCHDGKRASRECSVCHVSRQRINPHPPGFMRVHGQAALKRQLNCTQCHSQEFCTNCHTLRMPHPRNWMAIHGQQIGDGDCYKCHSRNECSQCHSRTEPPNHRRRDWIQTHGSAWLTLGSNCALCHSSRSCLNCHRIPMPHPSNWTSAHGPASRAQGDVCRRCHQDSECAACHGRRRILGHPMPFMAGHPAAARAQNPNCRVCHAPSFCAPCHPKGLPARIFGGGR